MNRFNLWLESLHTDIGRVWWNRLGYMLAALITIILVDVGRHLIKTDGELIVAMTIMIILIVLMGIKAATKRKGRVTSKDVEEGRFPWIEHPSRMELRFVQATWILLSTMILLGIFQKGPSVIQFIRTLLLGSE